MTPKPVAVRAPTRLDDDTLVPEELIGQLLDSSESAIIGLLDKFSPAERANLAMFCYRKTHLRHIGLAIAATCEQSTLVQAWGTGLGRSLFVQSHERAVAEVGSASRRPKITLARFEPTEPPPMLDPDEPLLDPAE